MCENLFHGEAECFFTTRLFWIQVHLQRKVTGQENSTPMKTYTYTRTHTHTDEKGQIPPSLIQSIPSASAPNCTLSHPPSPPTFNIICTFYVIKNSKGLFEFLSGNKCLMCWKLHKRNGLQSEVLEDAERLLTWTFVQTGIFGLPCLFLLRDGLPFLLHNVNPPGPSSFSFFLLGENLPITPSFLWIINGYCES